MKKILIIAKREFNSFFDSLIAYILIVVFLGFSGYFTWLGGNGDIFFQKQASIQPFFMIAYWTLFFFIPALTMRMLAEEKRSGTIELLLTKPVSDWEVVLGKFLACLALVGVAVLCSLPYYISVSQLGNVDHGAVWCGYLGILLMSSTFIGLGLLMSSLTKNQIVAFLLALTIGSLFLIFFGIFSNSAGGFLGSIFHYLNLQSHYQSIIRGVIDTKDLVYFISITFLCLVLAESSLSKRNVVE